ncbi:MAG: hypothetical protein EBT92_18740 [Planctomycetes bacterium]|nr:hypothetical protein [Planctomycetota bacterium]
MGEEKTIKKKVKEKRKIDPPSAVGGLKGINANAVGGLEGIYAKAVGGLEGIYAKALRRV